MSNISVTVKYFAMLREQSGIPEESFDTVPTSLENLYSLLSKKYGFTLPAARIKAAVNDQFSGLDYKPKDGDRIVFIPPVAGG